jgi:CheY-like chemotaxis protein
MNSGSQVRKPLIALVDDAEGVRFALGELLRSDGFEVALGEGGRQGVEMLQAAARSGQVPAVLVVDLVMDDVNGFDVITEAKRLLPNLPILAISGGTRNVMPDLPLELAAATGAAACLQKPFNNDDFLAAVRRLVAATDAGQ